MTDPAVSLLVPVFNRAELLIPCLDSALAQTMTDFEVVVVDGASTDGTWDVCLRYAAADSRIRVFRDDENTGPVRGWWRCVEEARGRYATFLWSDDLLRPTFLESTVPLLEDNNVAFVITAAEIGSEPDTGELHYVHPSEVIPSEQFVLGSLSGVGDYPVSPACALFRLADIQRSFLMELPTNPPVDLRATGAGVDVLLFLLTAIRYPRVATLAEPLAFFRAHPGSITVQGREGQVAFGYATALGWFARQNGQRQLARRILTRHWIQEMRALRRMVGPAAAATRYGHIVGARELVTTMAFLLRSKAARVVSARIRQVRHASVDVRPD